MNRHFKAFLLVIGGVLLVSGSALFGVGCATVKNTGKTREFDLSGQTIKSFNFDCDTSNVEFVATTDSTMKIVYKESDKIFNLVMIKKNLGLFFRPPIVVYYTFLIVRFVPLYMFSRKQWSCHRASMRNAVLEHSRKTMSHLIAR